MLPTWKHGYKKVPYTGDPKLYLAGNDSVCLHITSAQWVSNCSF